MVTAEDVLRILERLRAHGIWFRLTGGWGVDALLGEQTRPHKDLDLLIVLDDVVRLCELFARDGYQLHELWSENAWVVTEPGGADIPTAFVLQDGEGRQLDLHALRLDEQGAATPAWNDDEDRRFAGADLSGSGLIAGVGVPCVTATMQQREHTGYDLPDYQQRDMERLRRRR